MHPQDDPLTPNEAEIIRALRKIRTSPYLFPPEFKTEIAACTYHLNPASAYELNCLANIIKAFQVLPNNAIKPQVNRCWKHGAEIKAYFAPNWFIEIQHSRGRLNGKLFLILPYDNNEYEYEIEIIHSFQTQEAIQKFFFNLTTMKNNGSKRRLLQSLECGPQCPENTNLIHRITEDPKAPIIMNYQARVLREDA